MLQKVVEKMRAARRGHCQTCGCARCRRIDQLLAQISQRVEPHPASNGQWLIEGTLKNQHLCRRFGLLNGCSSCWPYLW